MEAKVKRHQFATAIHQHNAFLMFREYKESSLIEIENRLQSVETTFGNFAEQHTFFVANIPEPKQRAEQENYYIEMNRIYTKISQAYRRRIDQLRGEQLVQATSALFRSPISTKKENEPKQQQQQQQTVPPYISPQPDRYLREMGERSHSRSPIKRIQSAVVPTNDLRHRLQSGNRRVQRIPRADRFKSVIKCNYCQAAHPMFACPTFLQLPMHVRRTEVKELALCENCLMPNIENHRCRGGHRHCRRCGPKVFHNSVLCERGFY